MITGGDHMQLIEVVASPAERWALFEVVFQKGERALSLNNGAEGRAFRSFVESMGLLPIRETLARFGAVSAAMVRDETTFHVFRLTKEAVQLYREKIADLPRSAVYEVAGGELFSSLHGLGGPYHREGSFRLPEGWQPALWWRDCESWSPAVEVPAEALQSLTVRAAPIQAALERLQREFEELGPKEIPFSVMAPLLRFEEAVLLATKEALERSAVPVPPRTEDPNVEAEPAV